MLRGKLQEEGGKQVKSTAHHSVVTDAGEPRGYLATSSALESRVFEAINSFFGTGAWHRRAAEGLLVSYFTSEFNRCVDHLHLNRLVTGRDDPAVTTPWYQISLAGRLNDLRKVEFGQHGSVFEMLTCVRTYPREAVADALRDLTCDVLTFLAEHVGLQRDAIGVTYFAGGEVLPGVVLEPDTLWRDIWLEEGIDASNLVPIRGPKNYLMFVGPGERCGPRCEVLYRVPGSNRWMEVATLILDSGVLRADHQRPFVIGPPAVLVAGAAYGVERLVAASGGVVSLADTPFSRSLIDTAKRYSRQQDSVLAFLRGDLLVLVDQVRACVFLLAEEIISTSPQGEALRVMLRRIRRKLALLCVNEPDDLLLELEGLLLDRYAERYPQIRTRSGRLVNAVREVPWPEGWSPESYRNVEDHGN